MCLHRRFPRPDKDKSASFVLSSVVQLKSHQENNNIKLSLKGVCEINMPSKTS